MKSIVFMFSGQGSQYYQMGKELFVQDQVFRKWMIRLNDIAKQIGGISVIDQLYSEEKRIGEPFIQLKYTHPAIFMVEYAMAQKLLESRIEADFVMGTSLGEYAAAAVAGVLGVEEAMEAVIRHAQAIETYCSGGGMLAIIHDVNLFYELPLINKNSELAFSNHESHFVVSGRTEQLKQIEEYLKGREISYLTLPVNYAFHSSLINPAADSFISYLTAKRYKNPQIPFISCLYGDRLASVEGDYLWEVTRRPIKFREAVRELEREMDGKLVYLDLGPGGTLANVVKHNLKEKSQSESFAIITPFNRELKNLAKITESLNVNSLVNNHSEVNRKRQEIVYVFPGQGSQIKGMGDKLFDEFPEIAKKADEILGYSIKELCLQDPHNFLGKTQYTQPALYTVNALSYLKKIKDTGTKPDYLAGHSLGEYSALFAAGAFDFETGLKLVQKRGELMSRASGGGMAAVIGLSDDKVEGILRENGFDTIDIANYNSPTQIVLSGPKDEVVKAAHLFKAADAMYIPLNVSGAFHSRYMSEAKEKFEKFIDEFTFSKLEIPVISNVRARPYKTSQLKANLVEQIVCPVKWTESIRYLLGRGSVVFEEVGPGNVLTKLVDKIRQQSEPLVINDNE